MIDILHFVEFKIKTGQGPVLLSQQGKKFRGEGQILQTDDSKAQVHIGYFGGGDNEVAGAVQSQERSIIDRVRFYCLSEAEGENLVLVVLPNVVAKSLIANREDHGLCC